MDPKPFSVTVTKDEIDLPDFRSPPVDEVALSLLFAPIPGFQIPHYGLYWNDIRADYPQSQVQPPVPNLTEQAGTSIPRPIRFDLSLVNSPEVRCWFLDEHGEYLIQLQHDRFVVNWRKAKGEEIYPRYPAMRARLEKEWRRFRDFLTGQGLEAPKVNQCEVLYVNNIEYGKGWNGYGELDRVVATLATPKAKTQFLPAPERAIMQVVYGLEDGVGRLYVSFQPVIRARDGVEVLQMTLNARGAPKSPDDAGVLAWLDIGRKWVVNGFEDFTTNSMHEIWGKK